MRISLSLFVCVIIFISKTTVLEARPKGTLLSVVQVFRHGERTPTSFYPNDPYQDSSYWPVSEGQLTNVGKQEHFALGKFTRKRYQNFIPTEYTVEEVYVQTTDYDRTFMSAASNLAGLFPPKGDQIWNENLLWQPVTLHPLDKAVLSDYTTCPLIWGTITNLANTDEYYLAINEENAELYQYLTENSGSSVTNIFSLSGIRDSLYIEDRFGFELPAWTSSVYPEQLTNLTGYFWYAFGYTTQLRKLTSGVFLNVLIEQFENTLANNTTQKYLQFSGHDANIAAILGGLGVLTPEIPDFASTIYFELRQINGMPYVNVYFKNGDTVVDPVPITVSGCDFDCSLEDFKHVLSDILITADEWYNICSS